MRMVGFTVAALALALPAWSSDIYRWTDATGNVHYSNTPNTGHSTTSVGPDGAPAADVEPGDGGAGGKHGAAADDADTFSASASLRRNALERDFRATEKRLHEIDQRLAALARARGDRADAARTTSGVGTNLDVRSEEEKELAQEREKLAQHATEVQSDAARLRQEVTAHSGGATPDWWVDIR
jgi:hypothetical protein